MEGRLLEIRQVSLNGAGNGTASVGPFGREIWHPATVSIKVSTNTNEAQCSIYTGSDTTDRNFVDGTFSGSSGDSTDKLAGQDVTPGNQVFAVWTGGDANALATLSIQGTKTI